MANAIGPIWEANHVWLVLIVLLFTCFPRAYADLATSLHVPSTMMLFGIVLRGSAFTFRSYDSKRDEVQHRWGRIFSAASLATPVLLGLCLGAVASGRVHYGVRTASTTFAQQYIEPWLYSPFGWAVGVQALALFAFLAACYLAVEASDEKFKQLFRRHALQSQVALLLSGALTLWLARTEAPVLHRELTSDAVALGMQVITALSAVAATSALITRHFRWAQIAAAAQASFMMWGWAWAQFPFLLPPDRTITDLAASRVMLQMTLGALLIGTAILLPSFMYLFWIFKRKQPASF